MTGTGDEPLVPRQHHGSPAAEQVGEGELESGAASASAENWLWIAYVAAAAPFAWILLRFAGFTVGLGMLDAFVLLTLCPGVTLIAHAKARQAPRLREGAKGALVLGCLGWLVSGAAVAFGLYALAVSSVPYF